jgi:hypothetical protein
MCELWTITLLFDETLHQCKAKQAKRRKPSQLGKLGTMP